MRHEFHEFAMLFIASLQRKNFFKFARPPNIFVK